MTIARDHSPGEPGTGERTLREGELLAKLLYRDALMLIIDKPAGIPVHKGSGGGFTLDQRFDELRFGLPRAPALAHRLDRETSGCLALGRNREGLARLGKLFASGRITKCYWALVEGAPPAEEGVIDLPLAPQSADSRSWAMTVSDAGQPAVTTYRVLQRGPRRSLLALEPQTGRTHQLRVHCAASGFPIAGDWRYGRAPWPQARGHVSLLLHARALTVPLYPKKPPIAVEAPLPTHFQAALDALGEETPSG